MKELVGALNEASLAEWEKVLAHEARALRGLLRERHPDVKEFYCETTWDHPFDGTKKKVSLGASRVTIDRIKPPKGFAHAFVGEIRDVGSMSVASFRLALAALCQKCVDHFDAHPYGGEPEHVMVDQAVQAMFPGYASPIKWPPEEAELPLVSPAPLDPIEHAKRAREAGLLGDGSKPRPVR